MLHHTLDTHNSHGTHDAHDTPDTQDTQDTCYIIIHLALITVMARITLMKLMTHMTLMHKRARSLECEKKFGRNAYKRRTSAGRAPLFWFAPLRRAPLFKSLSHRTTASLFQLKFSRHCISATAPPRHLILAPPRHILGKKFAPSKKLRH